MMPASNQGVGSDVGFPDVCNTPIGTGTAPLPYPNTGQNATALPFTPTILLSFCPGHNQGSKALMTNGDEAGCAHSSFIMPGANNMGNPRIIMQGMPAETLCNPMAGNNYNCSTDTKTVPSLTNVLMTFLPAGDDLALAAEVHDAPLPSLGLTLERERGGWRVLHARRGGAGARARVREGDLIVGGLDAQALRVRRPGRGGEVALAPGLASAPPIGARLLAGGVGLLVVRRCSLGAPAAAARALAWLAARGARSLVLDLRGNPGGDLHAAAALAGLFGVEGALARVGAEFVTVRAGARPTALPLVTLVDGGTASAAEALAACLAETGRTVLVGARTRGKTSARPMACSPRAAFWTGHAVALRAASGARLAALAPDARGGLAVAERLARRSS